MTSAARLFIIMITLTLVSQHVEAQTVDSNKIIGILLSEDKDGKIEIFKSGNTYCGKLLWGKYVLDENGKPRHDINNPDTALRSQLLQGMIILKGLVFKDDKWDNGKIYDPISGRAYDVSVTLQGTDLALRGYIGIPLFGKTTIWKRIYDK